MYRNPIPLGPLNLWADADNISTSKSFTSSFICPTACTASVWNNAPDLCAIFANSLIGCIVPISLFANITDTKLVCFVTALDNSSIVIKPSFVGLR